MISYRELAMRVVGKPLRVSGTSPRPVAHRVTAMALTAAMVAALASPAFAGWTIDMSQVDGDVTITKDSNGTTIEVNGKTFGPSDDVKGVSSDGNNNDDSITIKGGSGTVDAGNNAGGSMFNNVGGLTEIDLDKSDTSNVSGTTDQTKTLEADTPTAPVVTDEDDTDDSEDVTYPDPTPVVTWPDDSTDPEDTTEEPETTEETEEQPEAPAENENEDTTGETPEGEPVALPAEGETPETLVSTLEAPAPVAPVSTSKNDEDDDSNAVTYESRTPVQVFTEAASKAVKNIIKIINNSKENLDVTLENVNVSGDNTSAGRNALTVIGTGDTTLHLVGDNKLQGGRGKDGLCHTQDDDRQQFGSIGSLTITSEKNGDGTYQGSLTATGGAQSNGVIGRGISSSQRSGYGALIISGGVVTATGGDDSKGTGTGGGDGIYSQNPLTISGGVVNATGGAGIKNGADNGKGTGIYVSGYNGFLTITGGTVTAAAGKNSSGAGMRGSLGVTISGGTVTATGAGNGSGIYSVGSGSSKDKGTVSISGDAVIKNAQGSGSGSGIYAKEVVEVKENAAVKATAGTNGGSAFKQGDTELTLDNVVQGDSAYAAAVDANDTTTKGTAPEGFPGYVEPENPNPGPENPNPGTGEPGSENPGTGQPGTEQPNPELPAPETPAPVPSSDGDSAPAPDAIVITPAGVPGFSFTGLLGGSVNVSVEVNGSTMEFRLLTLGGTLRTTLGQLRQLKEQGITHITFKTLLCTTTLALDDLLPLGDDAAEVVVRHTGTSAKVMVGGTSLSR